MDEKSKEQINKIYTERKKSITYSGKEVRIITGISLRTFRYRIEELREQYAGIGNLLELKKDGWIIHQDMVHHFFRKTKKRKIDNVYQVDWKTIITWAPSTDFPKEYHTHLIRQVMEAFPEGLFLPVIEQTESGVNHVHMLCTIDQVTIGNGIKDILKEYWDWWDYRIEIEPIQDVVLAVNYVLKDQLAVKSIIRNEALKTKILNRYKNEVIL